MEGVVPANVRAKRSKMLRGLSVKTPCFLRKSIGSNRTVLFESENEGYIHGFTENYVKVKHLGIQN
jgi:threonylcarbamoyladenosine tRNA methylthiotransferase MtaB